MSSIIKVDQIQNAAGTTGLTIDSSGSVSMPATTFIETWRIASDFSSASSSGTVGTNWEKSDDASYASVGTSMAESSGIFTFPVSGLYRVDGFVSTFNGGSGQDNYVNYIIEVSQNSGSSYDEMAEARAGGTASLANSGTCMALVNVTDVSTFRLRLVFSSLSSATTLQGDSNKNLTGVLFHRIADSQS